MSNNPHSHINQPAQNSWNPLQIPSYIPRQPQLAHMSNERPMVRSPLAWPPAPPPDTLYNFMSAANHKNLEHSMNPLLPPFVRGPPPFDSMDLSLQANRSAGSPLNKSLLPAPPPTQLDYGLKLQQQQHNLQQQQQAQQQMHAQNNYPIHNLSTNSPQSQQHGNPGMPNVSTATASSTPSSSPAQNTAKFMGSNGSDCGGEQPTSLIQPNQNLGSNNGSNYMRENYGKMASLMNRNFDNDPHSKSLQKPVELVNKDCNYGSLMPNKMPTTHLQQQQQTSKKHSPLRGGTNTGYHVSQTQQHQQQQHSPFNSPANTIKHNGPHTPPNPPQSPNMHQTQQQQQTNTGNNNTQQQQQSLIHGGNNNASLLDYNQLHLQQQQQQQQQHNSYTQSTHLQQQHLQHIYPPHLQQQQQQHQALHHQHWPQQQQQQQHIQQHSPMPPQSPMQPPPFNSPLHPQPQAAPQQTTLTNLEPASPATPSYSMNPESNFEQRKLESHPTAAAVASAPPIHSPPNRLPQNIPDSAESPTTNASSNDDDSNGDRDKPISSPSQTPTPTKLKKSNSNSPVNSKESPHSNKTIGVASPLRGHSKSPRSSPAINSRKSPRKAEINSPESLDLSSKHAPSPLSIAATSPGHTLTPTQQQHQPSIAALNADDDTTSQSPIIEAEEKLKNGHTPPINIQYPPAIQHQQQDVRVAGTQNDEVETIDKIAEMIAKTTSNSSINSNNSQHSHHSHCSNSNDATNSNASIKSMLHTTTQNVCESPKTKKQRQALKLRNAEQSGTTTSTETTTTAAAAAPNVTASNWSTKSYNESVHLAAKVSISNRPLINNEDDNAVLAEELRKETTTLTQQQHETTILTTPQHKQQRPLSPQSNSRSSSSSSSSSSCSNSTHSSYGHGRAQKSKPIDLDASATTKLSMADQAGATAKNLENVKSPENTATELPLNLNCKTDTNASGSGSGSATAKPASPDKATFEEVENKLEEMFAGIEDETPPLVIDKQQVDLTTAQTENMEATNLSVALELSNSLSDITMPAAASLSTAIKNTGNSPAVSQPLPVPIQTKAAKKSTVPSPIKPATPTPTPITRPASAQSKASSKDITDAPSPSPTPARKTLPRRRHSMALDPANLRIMFEDNNKKESPKETNKDVIVILDDEKPSTSAAAAAAAALANASSDDSNKHAKNRNNNGQNNNNNNNKGKSIQNSNNKSRTGNAAAKTTTTTTKRSKSNQRKQAQQKRRKNSSSEDEQPTAAAGGARESNTTTTTTTGSTSSSNVEKYKSPFILIKRDGSVSVVNAATAEDINADKQTKSKKPPTSYAHHHSQHRRNIRGFHSSTLSQKYDAETTDSSWICVFCKRGPHRGGLGDLFGPYLVTINCEEYKNAINAPDAQNLDEEFVNKRRRIDMIQCNPRGPPVVMATKAQEAIAAALAGGGNRMNKKKKKSTDEPPSTAPITDPLDLSNDTFVGMNKVTENSYEVWLHEDCTVWAPDVYLVGARIMGLVAAVWNSTHYQCIICEKPGATICCLQRDCKAAAHIPCAREAFWNLNESDCHVHCQVHSKITTTNTKNTDINKQNINQNQNTTNS